MTEETLLAEINTLIESENGKAIGLTDRTAKYEKYKSLLA